MKYVYNRLRANCKKLSFLNELLQLTGINIKINYINFKQLTELLNTHIKQ